MNAIQSVISPFSNTLPIKRSEIEVPNQVIPQSVFGYNYCNRNRFIIAEYQPNRIQSRNLGNFRTNKIEIKK